MMNIIVILVLWEKVGIKLGLKTIVTVVKMNIAIALEGDICRSELPVCIDATYCQVTLAHVIIIVVFVAVLNMKLLHFSSSIAVGRDNLWASTAVYSLYIVTILLAWMNSDNCSLQVPAV